MVNDMIEMAAGIIRDGYPRQAIDVLHTVINLAPSRVDALISLASMYRETGQSQTAQKLLQRARPLEPGNEVIISTLDEIDANIFIKSKQAHAKLLQNIGEANLSVRSKKMVSDDQEAPPLRVLMVNWFGGRVAGGDQHQIKKTKQYLENLGLIVDFTNVPCPDTRGYDLIHLWNLWFPHRTLPQIKAIRLQNPDIPIVLSPIYWDMAEKAWAEKFLPQLFAQARNENHLRYQLEQFVQSDNRIRNTHQEPNFRGYERYQQQILSMVDYLLPQSYAEMRNLEETLGFKAPYTVVRNAAEPAVFENATPDWFMREYNLRDFVLIVGLVETRKNQLMVLQALRDMDIPVVIVGRNYDRNYLRLCREHAPRRTLFIEHMPHELLASAYKAARVHVLPSWMECSAFSNVEAALSGCAMVVSDRTSEPEYYQDYAYSCNPADIHSIRNAILSAYENYHADAARRTYLHDLFLKQFTWENAARQTLEGYLEALALKKNRHLEIAGISPRPVVVQKEQSKPVVSIVIRATQVSLAQACIHSVKNAYPNAQTIVVEEGIHLPDTIKVDHIVHNEVALGMARSLMLVLSKLQAALSWP